MAVRPNFDRGTRTQRKYVRGSEDLIAVRVNANSDAARAVFEGTVTVFGRAAAAAVKDARENAVAAGRANIRSAGFPEAWANALQSRQYPKGGRPGRKQTEAFVNYRFGGVGSVFEFGATIRPLAGKKWLWIPAEGVKKSIYDPKARRPGGGLGASVRRTAGREFNLSKKGLKFAIIDGKPALIVRDSKAKKPQVRYWGRKIVKIPKKWNVMPLIIAEADKLPTLIEDNLTRLLRRRGG